MARKKDSRLAGDPRWHKDAIFYELRVRSFYDSNADGIGDFAGLTRKLDYLHELGVTALWLLPFYPSPLRDDGYDISDYTAVHPDCGTLADFKVFLREAHRRGLRVVTELVLNHTSDQHPWFQRARRSPPGSSPRNFYVWSDDPERYREARVIFRDFEPSNWSWDPLAKTYYWHRFYAHQPDLNFDNPEVRAALIQVVDFWLGLGVDGLRLDAVPYLFEREGTNCENLPETHGFLRELRAHVDSRFPNRMLLAEANQWPEDAKAYLGEDECHMAFHFPLMPRMFMAVRMEDRFPITDIWAQTPAIHETCQWALFLRNHDELTLEMVTDEERDYLFRAYAQESRMRINLGIRRRLAPLLGNNRRAIELNNSLLFSLPGTPVIYYGDEIGMGDNVFLGDRDGVRTPMQWSGDRNAGFSSANPQRLILPVIIDHEYHYQTVNVEAQESNRHSLLWWMRRLIALRRQFKAFGRGAIAFLNPDNPRILAFIRSYQDERILVVANLSRFVQFVELELSRLKGLVPVELFGRTEFPAIGELPYLLTLGPHAFCWFSLEQPRRGGAYAAPADYQMPRLEPADGWKGLLRGADRAALERVLLGYLPHCRWFGGKAQSLKAARIVEAIPVSEGASAANICLVDLEYRDSEPETYLIPLAVAAGERAQQVRSRNPERMMAELKLPGRNGMTEGLLHDATVDADFCDALLQLIERQRPLRGGSGEVVATAAPAFRSLRGPKDSPCEPRALKAEQSNSSVVYGERLILKLLRRVERGINPDLEISRFLARRGSFAHTPPLAGWLEYRSGRTEPRTLAVLQGFVPNQGDAWEYTRRELNRYFERAVTKKSGPTVPACAIPELLDADPDPVAENLIGAYLEAARLLGRRTAEMHLALAADSEDPEFAPEPYSALYKRSLYQSMRNLVGKVFRLLEGRIATLPEEIRARAQSLPAQHNRILERIDAFLKHPITVVRMRCHGDLHLGQMLYTGKDFVIIDFEGEPARPLSERRRKRSSLRDVAGMLRSFDYAAFGSLLEQLHSGALGKQDFTAVEPFARLWQTWVSWAFLKAYLGTAGNAPFVPRERSELRVLLDIFLLEKAVYELGYELNNRPDWLRIPIHGIEAILGVYNPAAN